MPAGVDWDTNGNSSDKQFVRYWRRRCLQKVGFVSKDIGQESQLAGIGALFCAIL